MAKLYDESGKEVEAFLPEEVTERQTAAVEAAVKAKEDEFTKEKTRLEEEVNPNWKKVRGELETAQRKAADYEKLMLEKGIKVEGEAVSVEQMRVAATKAAEQALMESHKRRTLSQYDEKQRPVVERFLEKLVAGEKISLDNIDSYIAQAEQLAGVGGTGMSPAQRAMAANQGRPPVYETNTGEDFSDSNAGKDLGNKLGIKI